MKWQGLEVEAGIRNPHDLKLVKELAFGNECSHGQSLLQSPAYQVETVPIGPLSDIADVATSIGCR
jgi:hypothetical protein